MVQNRAVDDAVLNVTEAIRNAADAAIPKTSHSTRKLCKPWWYNSCQQAKKEPKRAWGIFRRYTTTDNIITFKRAKALARRIRRQCQRESSIKEDTYQLQVCRQPLPYNCDFGMWELKRVLSSAHNTSPGPYVISYELYRHLNEDSLLSLLYLFNRIWREQASLYVDDPQISCEGSDMRMIERQLQTAVNNLVKWCDTNGLSISASKSCCVHFCRKRGLHPDPEIRIRDDNIPVIPDVRFLGVLSTTTWEADRTSLLRVYQSIVLSRMDYGCAIYEYVCNSALKKLEPVHHMALRICSGAFRTSPVQSLYVNCNQLPLDLQRRKLSLAYYFKILSVPSHPLQNVYMSTSMKRLYDARPSNIRSFMDRMKLLVSELDLPNHLSSFNAYHRSQHSKFSAIYTDGSKREDYVGCGVMIEYIMHGYRHVTSCSVFTAEAVTIYHALQLINSNMPRKYCIYTDSMRALEALENYNDRCHPVVCNLLDILCRLYSKGFHIVFCWLPSHVGIIGNEQADSAVQSAMTHLPLRSSAIGYETCHLASYSSYELAGIMESAVR
ncbi:RNase H domain-containing protein [Trichonephila clavipes]|nr:RNase H domain-containing protein [Trichonephila clavipes]